MDMHSEACALVLADMLEGLRKRYGLKDVLAERPADYGSPKITVRWRKSNTPGEHTISGEQNISTIADALIAAIEKWHADNGLMLPRAQISAEYSDHHRNLYGWMATTAPHDPPATTLAHGIFVPVVPQSVPLSQTESKAP